MKTEITLLNCEFYFRRKSTANLAMLKMFKTLKIGLIIPQLWKQQLSKVQREVLKHAQYAMEWCMKQKKLWPNAVCTIKLVWHVLTVPKNWILPTFMMPEMVTSTVANVTPQSKQYNYVLFCLWYFHWIRRQLKTNY